MRNFFYLLLGLFIITGSIYLFLSKPYDNNSKTIKIGNISISVEIADTLELRQQGLSGREMMPELTGMFFIFESPAQYKFWMKDMNFPIDIVWIDENFYIINIEKRVSPKTFPQTFSPDRPAKYALELPAGFSDKYRIEPGAMIQY